ncbi:ABC transporter permease [Actinomadura craniellae]|uniref:ABC transporter permease n=1 Tax=Actinomadura craniellae TaxID=2231787 RepID=A0A365H8Z7_9ACTN|nr:ABC transporter permease [Actinomadura craniellae]RAY14733.1 ABC transporter permease [Actinomadura craniellae]
MSAALLVRRLAFGALVLWLVSGAVFLLVHVVAADPARALAGPRADPETLALIRRNLGLDRPLVEQYARFAGRLLRGDLGHSYVSGAPVTELIGAGLPTTLVLVLGGAVLWLAGGVLLGVLSAVRPALDRPITFLVLLALSMPPFLLGLLLLFALFTGLGEVGVRLFEPGPPFEGDLWRRMALPWFTLALLQLAAYTRLTRGGLLDVLGDDYVRTARALGVTERRVVYRHGLRAALTPLVSQLGVDVGALLGGAVVVEQVFGLQGVGQLVVRSVTLGDAPVVVGAVLLTALCVVLTGLLTDLGYAALDPRVRLT